MRTVKETGQDRSELRAAVVGGFSCESTARGMKERPGRFRHPESLTAKERHRIISEAALFKALCLFFELDSSGPDWREAEAVIDTWTSEKQKSSIRGIH